MNAWKKIITAGALGLLLYVGIYSYALHSDGFKFVKSTLERSHVIQEKVGGVRKVKLSLFGAFKEKYVNSDQIVTVLVDVIGDTSTVTVDVKASRKDGAWKIDAALVNGVPITLD